MSTNSGALSRRRTVNVIAGVTLATALLFLGARASNAAPCQGGVKCFGACCLPGQTCVNKGAGASCQCPTGSFVCDGQCVTSSDENCGFCGNVCPEGTVCFGGTCQCAAGTVFCGGACVSTDCAEGEQFNFATCQCEATGGGGCTQEGGLCTSKNECCSATAKCVPSTGGRKVCHG